MSECGACRGTFFDRFFRAREWSTSGHYLSDPTETVRPVTFELEYCKSCGFIRQTSGKMVRLDYHEIERGTAKQLPAYSDRIIASLSEFGVGPDDFIVEVGANDGSFLLRSERSGAGPGRVYTVTYSVVDASKNSTTATALVRVPHSRE